MSQQAGVPSSRPAQNLAESKDLDQRIGDETDALREQIDIKNHEIAKKTKDLSQLVTENQELQQKLELVTNPATRYSLILDQGGGSFSAYLFATPGEGTKTIQLHKYKSVKLNELTDPALNAETSSALGVDMHSPDGSLNDFSFASPEHYPVITKWFAAFWKNLETTIRQSYGELSQRSVRMTGKIRAVLLAEGNEDRCKVWYDNMNAALGPDWDYKLLTNTEETSLEGEAFYFFNETYFEGLHPQYKVNQYAGVGVGSSSTQAYVKTADGTIVVGCDSTCGAKPSQDQKVACDAGEFPKPEVFEAKFSAIMKPVITANDEKKVVVATNAMGFLLVELTHPTKTPEWEGKAELAAAVTAGMPFPAAEYHAMMRKYVEATPETWAGNFMLGFFDALCSFPQTAMVMLEQKKHHGRGLPVETSWVMYLAQRYGGLQ